jgi:hypothetical protein
VIVSTLLIGAAASWAFESPHPRSEEQLQEHREWVKEAKLAGLEELIRNAKQEKKKR